MERENDAAPIDHLEDKARTADGTASSDTVATPAVQVESPTSGTYADPPPTYDRAVGDEPAENDANTDDERDGKLKRKKWKKDETLTSVTTTTTTTSTSTTTSFITHRPRPLSSSSIRLRSSSTDSYLDSLLARSVAALELSNALLQSTITTQSTLSSVLANDEQLDKQEKEINSRMLERDDKRDEWMREMEDIVRDVEDLFDIAPSANHMERDSHHSDIEDGRHPHLIVGPGKKRGDGSGLVFGDPNNVTRSRPPRALTQYVSITGASARGLGFAAESTADKDSIYLPSTTGLHAAAHKELLSSRSPSDFSASSSPQRIRTDSANPGTNAGSTSRRPSSISTPHRNPPTHLQLPSTSSLIQRSPPPSTHPESLPLSVQQLLELRSSGPNEDVTSTSPREDSYNYLRGLARHVGTPSVSSIGSGKSTSHSASVAVEELRQRLERPGLSPYQSSSKPNPHSHSPSIVGFTSFSALPRPEEHARTASNASTGTFSSSHSVNSSVSSRRRSSFRLPSPQFFSNLRRSPGLRSPPPPSPSHSSVFSSEDRGESSYSYEAPVDYYSPSLAAIPDDLESKEEGDYRGRTISPRRLAASNQGQGRAIQRGRFRTADTLRKLLDTSPSPHPSVEPNDIRPPKLTPSPDTRPRPTTRKGTMIHDLGSLDIHSQYAFNSSISSSQSLPSSALSPSAYSSSSDLLSQNSSDQDRMKGSSSKLTLRPPPRFMPRTPSRQAAGVSVSGATARAPKMVAHLGSGLMDASEENDRVNGLVEIADHTVSNQTTIDQDERQHQPAAGKINEKVVLKIDGAKIPTEHHSAERAAAASNGDPPPTVSSTSMLDLPPDPRARTTSLTASVSAIISAGRTLEHVKAANSGRFKGGSNLKGSPAWRAERNLSSEGPLLSPRLQRPSPPRTPSGLASETSSIVGSKRSSWIGNIPGLGLALTPSSSNGAGTPPLRVSFAQEPTRYSFERDQGLLPSPVSVDGDEEVAGADGTAPPDGGDIDDIDGGMTIKPKTLRRVQSWNGSQRGKKVPPTSSRKKSKAAAAAAEDKKEKGGWLDWFLSATAAGTNPGGTNNFGGMGAIGREEVWEPRRGDDW